MASTGETDTDGDAVVDDDAARQAATAARRLVEARATGALSTLATDPAGHPFGSLAPYALDVDGRPVLCLSSLAEHSANLEVDPRASLLVLEESGDDGAAAAGRVTLLGRARRLERRTPDDDSARELFRAAHPEAIYVDFPDFSMWILDVSHVRWIAGFGLMAWCGAAEYARA